MLFFHRYVKKIISERFLRGGTQRCFLEREYINLLYRHECFTGKYTTRKIHKNYIRDPSGLFSIISHVSLSMISLISSLSLKLYLNSLVYHRNIFGSSSKVFENLRKSSDIFGNFRKFSENVRERSSGLRTILENLRKSVVSKCCHPTHSLLFLPHLATSLSCSLISQNSFVNLTSFTSFKFVRFAHSFSFSSFSSFNSFVLFHSFSSSRSHCSKI